MIPHHSAEAVARTGSALGESAGHKDKFDISRSAHRRYRGVFLNRRLPSFDAGLTHKPRGGTAISPERMRHLAPMRTISGAPNSDHAGDPLNGPLTGMPDVWEREQCTLVENKGTV